MKAKQKTRNTTETDIETMGYDNLLLTVLSICHLPN